MVAVVGFGAIASGSAFTGANCCITSGVSISPRAYANSTYTDANPAASAAYTDANPPASTAYTDANPPSTTADANPTGFTTYTNADPAGSAADTDANPARSGVFANTNTACSVASDDRADCHTKCCATGSPSWLQSTDHQLGQVLGYNGGDLCLSMALLWCRSNVASTGSITFLGNQGSTPTADTARAFSNRRERKPGMRHGLRETETLAEC